MGGLLAGGAAAAGLVSPQLAVASAAAVPAASVLLDQLVNGARHRWARRAERVLEIASEMSGNSAEDLIASLAEVESGFLDTFLRAVLLTGSAEQVVLMAEGLNRAAEQHQAANQIEFEKDVLVALTSLGGEHMRVLRQLADRAAVNQKLTSTHVGIVSISGEYPSGPIDRWRMFVRLRRSHVFHGYWQQRAILAMTLKGHIRAEACLSKADIQSTIRSVFPSAWDEHTAARMRDGGTMDFDGERQLDEAGIVNRVRVESPAVVARLVSAGVLTSVPEDVFVAVPTRTLAENSAWPLPSPDAVSIAPATHSVSPFGLTISERLNRLSGLIARES